MAFNEAAAISPFQQHWDILRRRRATFEKLPAPIWRLPCVTAVINASDAPLERESEKSSCFRQPVADKRTHPRRLHWINRWRSLWRRQPAKRWTSACT